MKRIFLFMFLSSFCMINGLFCQVNPTDTIVTSGCGSTAEFMRYVNYTYHEITPPPTFTLPPYTITDQTVFISNGLNYTCPNGQADHFVLYFEDDLPGNCVNGFNLGTVDNGFDRTTNKGITRRDNLCAVLNYIEQVIDIPQGVVLDLHIGRSYTAPTIYDPPVYPIFPGNPAPVIVPGAVEWISCAASFYPLGFTTGVQGIYPGYLNDHIVSHVDPDINYYDATLCVNFDKFLLDINSPPKQIKFWEYHDFSTPLDSWDMVFQRKDLFTVLLHDLTHAMGWISNIEENPSNGNMPFAPNNCFTLYDFTSLFYNDNISSFIPNAANNKPFVVFDNQGNPIINPAINFAIDPLRKNRVWLNEQPKPYNQPVFGTADVNSANHEFFPKLFLNHLNYYFCGFPLMAQYSPGYLPHYLMGPRFNDNEVVHEWHLTEIRELKVLGYTLNPPYASQTLNTPPFTTEFCTMLKPLITISPKSNPNAAISYSFPDVIIPQYTIQNLNTPISPTMSFLPINLSDLELGLVDPENDPITVIPNSVFGIRGVSDGANNHARLLINQAGNEFTYIPEPGYHGLAQFGFRVTDGIEEGAVMIVTIKVNNGGAYILTPGDEMVINGNYEDGTEVRKQDIYPPTKPYTTRNNEQIEGEFYVGSHFSGGHPFSQISNINPFYGGGTGDIIEDSYHYKQDFSNIDPRERPNFGASNNNHCSSISGGIDDNPASNPSGERYHRITGFNNYSTLINPVQSCHYYTFECDLYWTGLSQSTTLSLDFVEEPIAFTPQLPIPPAIRSIPFNYTSVKKQWTHIAFCFEYCGEPTSTFRLVSQLAISNWSITGNQSTRIYCDNLSLKENQDPPEITITAAPFPIAHQDCPVTLSVNSTCDLCTMSSYKWFVSDGGGPYTLFSTTTAPTTTITLPNLHIYSIYVEAQNNCSAYTSDPISLTVEVSTLSVALTTTDEDCHGTQNGTAAIIVSPLGNITSVNWFQNGVLIPTPAPLPFTMSFDNLSADNYTVKVTDIFGCEIKNYFTINESRTDLWPYHPFQDGKADGTAIVVDTFSNVYTAGIFTDKIVFDVNYGFNAGGFTNIFLLKQDQCGYVRWALRLESHSARVNDMVLDNGNIIIVGKFNRMITFPGGLTFTSGSVSDQDGFIASFDTAGPFLWARQIDGTSNWDAAEASGVCVDQNNNIYAVGSFNGVSIQFLPNAGPIPTLSNLDNQYGTSDIWLAKYSNTGTLLNYQHSGTANPIRTDDFGRAISYCSNCTSGQIAITGIKENNRRFWEIYNSNLFIQPAFSFLLPGLGEGISIHFAHQTNNDHVFITSLKLYTGVQKAVASKYTTNGNNIWDHTCGNITTSIPDKFTDSKYYNGRMYVTGEFGDADNDFPIVNPNKSFTNLGSPATDNLVSRIDINGNFDLLMNSEGLSAESSNSLDVDVINTGNIFYTGCFMKTSILGADHMDVPLLLFGPDFFIARVINTESAPTYDRPVNTNISPILQKFYDKEILLYPNPSSGVLTIETTTLANKKVKVSLFNSLGKVVMNTTNVIPSSGNMTFDLSNYPSGIYCIELNDNFKRLTAKFVMTK